MMRQALYDAVVYEFITIKTRQPVVSAEPEKATWIGNDLEHTITRQAVSGGVSSNRKLFSALLRAGDENEYEDDDRSLHSADIITSYLRVRHQTIHIADKRPANKAAGAGVSRHSSCRFVSGVG